MVTLENKLVELGEKCGCWFTIERCREVPKHDNALRLVPKDFDVGATPTPEQLVKALKSQFPGASVTADSANPRILHLVEKELENSKNYKMQSAATLEFKGALAGLAPKIGESIPGIGGRQGGGNLNAYDDGVTIVEVRAKDKGVREILTDAVPIEKYNRVLWVAESFTKEDGSIETWIQFSGPLVTNK